MENIEISDPPSHYVEKQKEMHQKIISYLIFTLTYFGVINKGSNTLVFLIVGRGRIINTSQGGNSGCSGKRAERREGLSSV